MSRKNHNFLNYFCHLYSWKVGFYQAHCVTAIKGLSAKAKKKPFVKKGVTIRAKNETTTTRTCYLQNHFYVGEVQPYLGSPDGFHGLIHILMCSHTKWPFFSSNQWPWESSKSWFFAIHVISVFCRRLKSQESALKWAKIRETVLDYIFVSYNIAQSVKLRNFSDMIFTQFFVKI